MTSEEKVIYYIREGLVEKHGEEFLELSEDEQGELIIQVIRDYIAKA